MESKRLLKPKSKKKVNKKKIAVEEKEDNQNIVKNNDNKASTGYEENTVSQLKNDKQDECDQKKDEKDVNVVEKNNLEKKEEIKKKPLGKRGINIAAIRKMAEERRLIDEQLRREKEEAEKKHQEELKRREIEKEKIRREKEMQMETEKARKSLARMKILRAVERNPKKIIEKPQIPKNVVNDKLKSPICCILGHVDTGKTKLLDKLRESNVQGNEAGGITQQIGATYFPIDDIRQKCSTIQTDLPGILIIDTPGHESFTNLRTRGSSLCDLAILVVDILHLLEKQTLESIEILKMRKTPFIVALNKIDRLFKWQPGEKEIQKSLASQSQATIADFEKRVNECILKFAEIGLNAKLYYENPNEKKIISIVPTSAITGEGLPDLLSLIIRYSEIFMSKRVIFKDELLCTVLEVKEEPGFGPTLDVILSNGRLREGDKICICGSTGPIVTTIRALLTPQPMKELRIKSQYVQQKEVRAALGVKISAPDLGTALAGSKVLHYRDGAEEEVMEDLQNVFNLIKLESIGIHVQASTLGSLEALLQFVKTKNIPISSIGVGPVIRRDITKISVMREKAPEFCAMLCFDIRIDKEITEFAASKHVKIFNYNIIYNLIEAFEKYLVEFKMNEKKSFESQIIFPFQAKIIPECVFTTRPPFVFGVEILRGHMKINTPVFVMKDTEVIKLGRICSIENNRKSVDEAKIGDKIAIKIESDTGKMYGRHFDHKNLIEPVLTRNSIDMLKKYYKDDLSTDDWRLVVEIKKKLGII